MGYQYSVTSLLQSLHLKLQAVISSLMTTITKKTCENVKKTATKLCRKMFTEHLPKCSTFCRTFVENIFQIFPFLWTFFCRTFFENVHGRNNFTNVRQIWVWKGKNLGWNFDKFSIVNIFFFVHGVNNFDFICRFKVSFYCSAVFLKLFIKYFA